MDALLETAAKRELQQLFSNDNNQGIASLLLYGLYDFVLSINTVRALINNDGIRPMGLSALTRMTYLIFDLYREPLLERPYRRT